MFRNRTFTNSLVCVACEETPAFDWIGMFGTRLRKLSNTGENSINLLVPVPVYFQNPPADENSRVLVKEFSFNSNSSLRLVLELNQNSRPKREKNQEPSMVPHFWSTVQKFWSRSFRPAEPDENSASFRPAEPVSSSLTLPGLARRSDKPSAARPWKFMAQPDFARETESGPKSLTTGWPQPRPSSPPSARTSREHTARPQLLLALACFIYQHLGSTSRSLRATYSALDAK